MDDFPAALKLPALVAWTAVLFAAIAIVADTFFAPAVGRIAERLKLPEDVAGATLLALGGAAPDIFTQVGSRTHIARNVIDTHFEPSFLELQDIFTQVGGRNTYRPPRHRVIDMHLNPRFLSGNGILWR